MNILCYSSCYGAIFKDKLTSNTINIFDCIYWYERPKSSINFQHLKNYQILICEYIKGSSDIYSSDEFINIIKGVNPNIKVVTYPLIILNIFPFHKHAFGFLSSNIINTLIQEKKAGQNIVNLYLKDKIKFNPIDGFKKSLVRLKEIEEKCDIKVSHIIENTFFKERLFVDSILPSNTIFNYLCEEIKKYLNLNVQINYNQINNSVFQYHNNIAIITSEMADTLNIPNLVVHPNHKEYYLGLLKEYLSSKEYNF
jgi:hypothetical protein